MNYYGYGPVYVDERMEMFNVTELRYNVAVMYGRHCLTAF